MKVKLYRTETEMFFYKRYKTIELFKLKLFPSKFVKSWMDLLGCKREVEAERICRDVFNVFLELMVEDLFNDDLFIFPMRAFGYLKITDKTDYQRREYIYDFNTKGRYFKPQLVLDKRVTASHRRRYVFRFNSILSQKLYELVKKGRLFT